MAIATLVGKMYVLDVFNDIGSANATTLETRHERFAHVHPQGIGTTLIRNNVGSGTQLVGGLRRTDNTSNHDYSFNKCSTFVYGKDIQAVVLK